MAKPVVVIGGGGHASVLVDILKQQKRDILALISPDDTGGRAALHGLPRLESNQDILKYSCSEIVLVNGIGSIPGSELRWSLADDFLELGYEFETVVSSDAIVSPYAELGTGVQVMAGVVIQAGTKIGSQSIINTAAHLDHDCLIAKCCHIAPGAALSGGVNIGEYSHVGPGAVLIQSISVGAFSVVGAGAVVNKDIGDNKVVYPLKAITKNR